MFRNDRRFIHSAFGTLAVLLLLLGCRVDVTPPEVISYNPAHQSSVQENTTVTLSFNKKMDRTKTEKAFSLFSSDTPIEGTFKWTNNSKTIEFIPYDILLNGYYRMVLSRSAVDTDGVTLKTEHISSFFVGEDRYPPEVISVNPASLENTYPLDGVITVEFSEPMDQMSVQRGIRLSPGTEGSFAWTADNTGVTFIPFTNLSFNTEYTITVTKECADTSGNTILHDHVSYFRSGDEFVRPSIISLYTSSSILNWATFENYHHFNEVQHTDIFTFTFNESIQRESFESALRFNPAIDVTFRWNTSSTECVVTPGTDLSSGRGYQLLVSTALKDRAGNSMLDERVYLFTVDALTSIQPEITGIQYNENELVNTVLNELGNEEPAALSTYTFEVTFNSDLDRSTIPGNIIIDCINGEATEIGGSIQQYQWTPGDNRNLDLTLTSIEGGNVYRLTFRGGPNGITGRNGIHMAEDHVILFRFDPLDQEVSP